jgi:transcriptional regulator with PAS, ATPase and Fis domain
MQDFIDETEKLIEIYGESKVLTLADLRSLFYRIQSRAKKKYPKDINAGMIQEALLHNNGSRIKAAFDLGISIRTLYRKIREFDL